MQEQCRYEGGVTAREDFLGEVPPRMPEQESVWGLGRTKGERERSLQLILPQGDRSPLSPPQTHFLH